MMKIRNCLLMVALMATASLNGAQEAVETDPSTRSAASPTTVSGPAQLTLDDLRTFTEVFSQIRRNYVGEVDDRTLLHAAIDGMLSSLDPHSSYLPGDEYKNLDDTARGRYSGIGVDVRVSEQKLEVRQVIVPSPADSAGITPGDVITAIDGKAIKGRDLQEAIDELLGEPGTRIAITVLTPDGVVREVEMTREYVKVPTLSFKMLDRNNGYFKITHFNRDTASTLQQTLDSLNQEGVVLSGLVIDLRDNPGGVLQPAVEMADGFIDEGLIVSTRGRNATMQMEFRATPGQWLPGVSLIIIVDRGTASAAEVLAGALQDHKRALIIGERTFGKGSVQSVLPLRNGSGMKLTTARYYTPSGRSIQAEGIRPDVVIESVKIIDEDDHRKREADLDRHLDNDSEVRAVVPDVAIDAEEDYPLHEALSILKGSGILSGEGRAGRGQSNTEEDRK